MIEMKNIEYKITTDLYELLGKDFLKKLKVAEKNFHYGVSFVEPFSLGSGNLVYFVAMEDNEIVSIIKLRVGVEGSRNGFENWICFSETHPEYRNRGLSKQLKRMVFEYCAENELSLLSSGFTVLGHKYGRPTYIALAKEFGVEYAYRDSVDFFDYSDSEGMDKDEYEVYVKKYSPGFGVSEYTIINKK